MTTCRVRAWAITALAVGLFAGRAAWADEADEQAAARALFNDGRALLKAGHYVEACPKLEAAARLYRGSGVLLNLADCYERIGRTASAWNDFGEAATQAAQAGRAVDEAEARRRQGLLEPQLAHVVIQVSDAAPSLTLTWDGKELLTAAWQTPIPVDPGEHRLAATAPGYAPWAIRVDVPPHGTERVDVPPLERLATSLPLAPLPSSAPYWTLRRKLGVGTAVVGVAGLGAAAVFAAVARSDYARASGESGAPRVHDSGNAVTLGNVATGLVSAGAALAALGGVVWLTAPNAPLQAAASPGALWGTF